MPLDILYVGRLPPFRAGSAVITAQVLRKLAHNGHRVRAIADCMDRLAHLTDQATSSMPEFPVTYFPTPDWPMLVKGSGTPEYRKALSEGARFHLDREIGLRRPDVVLFGIEQHLPGVIDVAVDANIPCAMISHGPILAIIDGAFEPETRRRMMDAVTQADLLFACASHAADRMRSADLPPVELIANSVDTELFSPRDKALSLLESMGKTADERIVLHVSNYAEAKRTHDVVASAARVVQARDGVTYLFVGDNKRQRVLEDACERAGILDNVRFVDWVAHEDMPAYYSIADIVVSASQSEVLSLVYLEAQASGRTLVASDITAAREVVEDGVTGLLFEMGDVGALTQKTIRALDDPTFRASIGRAARDHVVRSRSLDAAARQYERALQHLADQPRA